MYLKRFLPKMTTMVKKATVPFNSQESDCKEKHLNSILIVITKPTFVMEMLVRPRQTCRAHGNAMPHPPRNQRAIAAASVPNPTPQPTPHINRRLFVIDYVYWKGFLQIYPPPTYLTKYTPLPINNIT